MPTSQTNSPKLKLTPRHQTAAKPETDSFNDRIEKAHGRATASVRAATMLRVQRSFAAFAEKASLADVLVMRDVLQAWEGYVGPDDNSAALPGAFAEFTA